MTPDDGDRRDAPVTLDARPDPDGRWTASAAPPVRGPGWLVRLAQFAAIGLVAVAATLVWLAAFALLVVLAPIALIAGGWLWHKASRQAAGRRMP